MKTNELKCTDLRIGNLIDYFGDIIKVDTIDYFDGKERVGGVNTTEGDRVFDKPSYFEPIELTEEVLLKIGFVKENEVNRMYNNRCVVSYYIGNFYKELVIEVRRENGFYKNNMVHYDIKYLHQLQNAYYLLTNEELEVNL